MEHNILAAIIIIVAAALPGYILAFAIGVKQAVNLIAGWDGDKVSDHKAYAQLTGAGLFFMANTFLVVSIMLYMNAITENELLLLIMAASLIPLLIGLYANIKYKN